MRRLDHTRCCRQKAFGIVDQNYPCVLMDNVLYDVKVLELSEIHMIRRRINIDSENEKGAEMCCGFAALVVVQWSHAERRADFIQFVSFSGGIGVQGDVSRRIDVDSWKGKRHQGHNTCFKEYS